MIPFSIVIPESFAQKLNGLPKNILEAARKAIHLLAENPRHPALKTHKVKGAVGDFAGDVFEAYVSKKYRMTWEYGPDQGMIALRNIDNHDEYLEKP